MLQVEHTKIQKLISLLFFVGFAVSMTLGAFAALQSDSSFTSKCLTISGFTFVTLIFAYPCWFTLTYHFQVDDLKISRKAGFRRTEIAWADIATWSVKTLPKADTFNQEPILRDIRGREISLNSYVWHSAPNMAHARENFLALVQARIPDKQIDKL